MITAALEDISAALGPRGFTRDPAAMAPWLSDWRSEFHGAAAALVSPASTAEVQRVVRTCASAGIAIVPQGGNTSLVGGATPDATGRAVLLSTRRLNAIRSLSTTDNIAVAEAGVILSDLHDAARAKDRRFPLSLAAKGSATVGGLVSTNAGGTQVLRHGTMRGLTIGVEGILADGTLIDRLQPLRKDTRGFDLRQLFIGTEGTLGVVTAAALHLAPALQNVRVIWGGFQTPAHALDCLRLIEAELGPVVESFELVPLEAVQLVVDHLPGARHPIDAPAPWQVLIELDLPKAADNADDLLLALLGSAMEKGILIDATLASSEAQAEAMWRLRESVTEAERARGRSLKHDIAVAVSAMPAFLDRGRAEVLRRYPGARILAFGHLGDGNIHFNVQAPAGAEGGAWLERHGASVTSLLYEAVAAAGGTISAEHGIGQLKAAALEDTMAPAELDLLRTLKRALDPGNIMNPGKIVRSC